MFIDSSVTSSGSVRRSGRQVDLLPLDNHSNSSNGARGGVELRSINISHPNGVEPALRDCHFLFTSLLPLPPDRLRSKPFLSTSLASTTFLPSLQHRCERNDSSCRSRGFSSVE